MSRSPDVTAEVALGRCPDYDPERVEGAVRRILHLLGGMGSFVRSGETVLIKPNLLAPKPAERAVNTHPAVVGAVLKAVLEAGGRPVIGDSPGLGSAAKNAARCGLARVAADLQVPIVEFRESVPVGKTRRGGFPLELAGEALAADAIINLPKFKTHGQVLFTLGVKNMFGCVIGKRKAQWHLKAGVNRKAFAEMLVQIYRALRPRLTLIDGIVGMDGNGPGSGRARPLGWIAASADAVALDTVLMGLAGMDPLRLPTIEAARRSGVGETVRERIRVLGDRPEDLLIRDLKIPDSADLEWKLPDFLMGLLKESLSATPRPDPRRCEQCNICVEACPQQVIRRDKQGLEIDTRHCIRCFCCQELCPHEAMGTRQGWLLKLLKKL